MCANPLTNLPPCVLGPDSIYVILSHLFFPSEGLICEYVLPGEFQVQDVAVAFCFLGTRTLIMFRIALAPFLCLFCLLTGVYSCLEPPGLIYIHDG